MHAPPDTAETAFLCGLVDGLARLPEALRRALMRHPDPEVQHAVALEHLFPGPLRFPLPDLATFAQDTRERQMWALEHGVLQDAPEDYLRELLRYTPPHRLTPQAQEALYACQYLPLEIALEAACSRDPSRIALGLRWPGLPPEVLAVVLERVLALKKHRDLLRLLLAHPRLPLETLILHAHPRKDRARLIRHLPALPPELLDRIVQQLTLPELLAHPLSPALLERLAPRHPLALCLAGAVGLPQPGPSILKNYGRDFPSETAGRARAGVLRRRSTRESTPARPW